jgi:uncharacterized membrane protein YkvA (DUF1232 family)
MSDLPPSRVLSYVGPQRGLFAPLPRGAARHLWGLMDHRRGPGDTGRTMDFPPPDYAASLRAFVRGYQGSRQDAVAFAPDVFTFFARLLVDERLPRDARPIVSAVLAYFVVPDDVMPEADLGPLGLMDDLYAAAHAYRTLRREIAQELLADAWVGEVPVEDAFSVIYTQTRAELGKRTRDVLRMAGLH